MKITLFIIVAALIVGAFFYFEKTRSDALSRVANEIGFNFQRGQQTMPDELSQLNFYLFAQGDQQISNLMQGTQDGYSFSIFGYFYRAGVGMEGNQNIPNEDVEADIQNRGQTAIWITSNTSLPDFDLSPTGENIRRVAQQEQFQNITFDGQQAFREKYILTGRDYQAVSQVFSQDVIDFLLANPSFTFESRGNNGLLYRNEDRVSPENISTLLSFTQTFLNALTAAPVK